MIEALCCRRCGTDQTNLEFCVDCRPVVDLYKQLAEYFAALDDARIHSDEVSGDTKDRRLAKAEAALRVFAKEGAVWVQ